MIHFSPLDQDGWLGEFSGGQEYPLLWKEGEVYLLPFTEEDTGFYKAPGESESKIIEIWPHPLKVGLLLQARWVVYVPLEDNKVDSCVNKAFLCCSFGKYVNDISVSGASVISIACSCCSLARLIRRFGSGSCSGYSDTISSNPLSDTLEDKGISWPSYRT